MGVFDKLKKKTNAVNHPEKSIEYTSTKHFRGYKRTKLVAYGYANCQENTDSIFKAHTDLVGLPVRLDVYADSIMVYVDGLCVGGIYDSVSYYEEARSGKVTNVYIEKNTNDGRNTFKILFEIESN